jgi:C_GCAxxG_C_C family probable redox protein
MDAGWSCAESVVAELAHRQGIESDLLPAIATGFCGGVSRTGGMCGAVSGAVMAISLANGRKRAADSREPTYAAVQGLVDGFAEEFGSVNCSELLGLNLGADEGRAAFRARGLNRRCRSFACRAAEIAAEIIDRVSADKARASVTAARDDVLALGPGAATPLAAGERAAMGEALRRAGLPADDLDDERVRAFAFADRDGALVGYGGLEIHGDDALVRSIVVEPSRRRRGAGRAIVERLLAEAAALGVERAYLLTTNARVCFERLGFAAVARADAPPAILATRQAIGLCPASAVLMVRSTQS